MSFVMSASAFKPLLPEERAQAPLLAQAAVLIAEGHRLESAAGQLGATLRPLLWSMNSYYTNKIEGQHTRPRDIERALHQQFDADKKQARRQRLALAHIQAERRARRRAPEYTNGSVRARVRAKPPRQPIPASASHLASSYGSRRSRPLRECAREARSSSRKLE